MEHSGPEKATAALRDELLSLGWPTSAEVGQANDSQAADPALWAKTKRDAGELLGVWDPSINDWRHPSFQFQASGTLRTRIPDLLAALAEIPYYRPEADPTGWRRAFWLYGSNASLAGVDGAPRATAEVFVEDPDRVIQSARELAVFDPNVYW
jgi:hypothetical protein